MEQGLLVTVQLRQQSAYLHVDLALVLQLFQLLRRLLAECRRQVLRVDLMETGVEAESTLFKSSHFLETKCHIVHSHLDQEAVLRVLLELESIEEGLSLL